MENAIEVRGLCKAFAKKDFSLQDLDLTVPKGSIVGLIGENGAGKTTTLKCILGILRKDAGEIYLLGGTPGPAVIAQVGTVFEDAYFPASLTTRQIARILRGMYRADWDQALFETLCRRFDLTEGKMVKDFSRGMRMKLSLATALAHHPRLLILDEATSGLDPVVRGEILDLFLEFIQDEDHSILLSSHITSDLDKIADHVILLDQGRIQFNLPKDKLEEECCKVFLEEIDENIRPYLKGIKRHANGYEALCINSTRFMDDDRYQFSRATIEEIMYYWEIKNE